MSLLSRYLILKVLVSLVWGAVEFMRDAVELSGAPGPLLLQLEKLWNSSDDQADLSIFGSAPFLLTEGRGLFNHGPAGMSEQLTQLLGGDMRGFSLQMRLEPQWYVETRFIGANDQEAGKVLARKEQWLRSLPPAVESQLVSTTPHPHWRCLPCVFRKCSARWSSTRVLVLSTERRS